MNLEEIKTRKGLLLAAILESNARIREIEAKLEPLKQALFKEQEIQASTRLSYELNERARFALEKPSPEATKQIASLMKAHGLTKELATEVVAMLRKGAP